MDQEKTKVEPGQPQLSPGISTIHLHPQFPGSLCCSLLFVRIVSREEEDKEYFCAFDFKVEEMIRIIPLSILIYLYNVSMM